MYIEFIKCHGSGNDFILIDALSHPLLIDTGDMPRFSRAACDRNGPLGADGVLLLLPSENADARMRIFNCDGSEAEMCGNGIRCLARLAGRILDREQMTIETAKAVLQCRKEDDIYPGVESCSVLIDNVSLVCPDLPFTLAGKFIDRPLPGLDPYYMFSAVSLGNPHVVAHAAETIDDSMVSDTGRRANLDKELFPAGVNVTFFNFRGPQQLYAVTYERGVGLTWACGTAMSASSIAACKTGLCDFGEWIEVYNKGGMVKCLVEENPDLSVRLLGNATFQYRASVEYQNGQVSEVISKVEYVKEEVAYEAFRESLTPGQNTVSGSPESQ